MHHRRKKCSRNCGRSPLPPPKAPTGTSSWTTRTRTCSWVRSRASRRPKPARRLPRPWATTTPRPASLYSPQIYFYDYPGLFWLGRSIDAGLTRVFDLGGHIGIKYYAFRRVLSYPDSLRWTVCDVPSVVEQRPRLAAQREATASSPSPPTTATPAAATCCTPRAVCSTCRCASTDPVVAGREAAAHRAEHDGRAPRAHALHAQQHRRGRVPLPHRAPRRAARRR
jgi:hypothetical protein